MLNETKHNSGINDQQPQRSHAPGCEQKATGKEVADISHEQAPWFAGLEFSPVEIDEFLKSLSRSDDTD